MAAVAKLPDRVAGLFSAFGGGILFAAVGLELVPEADREGERRCRGGDCAGVHVGYVLSA